MDDDGFLYFATAIVLVLVLTVGIAIGSMAGKDSLAHDVCVTYGYDTGSYTQGEIVCGYNYAVPDELAPLQGDGT